MKLLLVDVNQAHAAISTMWQNIRPQILDGKRLWVSVHEETRTLPQNAKFHGIATDLAKSPLEWAGKRRQAPQWKVLLVSGHAVATKSESEIVPGLEGEFVNLRESTALMSISRGSSLIEYSTAFCVMNEVPLRDPQDYRYLGLLP